MLNSHVDFTYSDKHSNMYVGLLLMPSAMLISHLDFFSDIHFNMHVGRVTHILMTSVVFIHDQGW